MVFIAFYLVTSIVAGDFYKIPITVAFMVSSIYAIAAFRGKPMKERVDLFSRGAATEQMMLMIWIFVLAGAFAHAAKAMGCIDATVNLTLSLLPPQMILAGMFLAACFVSISIGTSVGTIAALVPIAAGVANETNTDLALMTAIIVGGSFFGDNLSFISDTTIMATIVFPVALLVFVCYLFMGSNVSAPPQVAQVEWVKVIPYLVVLIIAIFGMNVMAVLTLGILLTGVIGILTGSIDLYGWFGSMGEGILSMGGLIIVTMMAGGMLELIRQQGGIDFIIRLLTRHVSNKRGAELSIAVLVSLVNVCTANNTVAILTVGDISKQIGDRFGVDNRKCASILDTFSCTIQGMLPYGAQILIAAGLASLSPVSIIPYLYYPFVLGVVALLSILLCYPRRYS